MIHTLSTADPRSRSYKGLVNESTKGVKAVPATSQCERPRKNEMIPARKIGRCHVSGRFEVDGFPCAGGCGGCSGLGWKSDGLSGFVGEG